MRYFLSSSAAIALILFCLLIEGSAPSQAASVIFLGDHDPVQGEVFPVRVYWGEVLRSVRVRFGDSSVYLRCRGKKATGFFGFDLAEKPGQKRVEFILEGKKRKVRVFKNVHLKDAHYPVERLEGIDERYVEPGKEDLKRIRRENVLLKSIWRGSQREIQWDEGFVLPFSSFKGRGFGKRRFINGEPRSPHTGVDASAPRGTPVHAISGGIVKLARNLFFSGNSVIIDHGGGLFSMYFHLDSTAVHQGTRVRKGDLIGTVGSTGRATAPHLHLGIRFVDMRVNPMDMLP